MGRQSVNFIYFTGILLTLFAPLSTGQDEQPGEWQDETNGEYTLNTNRVATCPCKPCSTGPNCEQSVGEARPRFQQRFSFVELSAYHDPSYPLSYNSTTYTGSPGCACPAFVYSIAEVSDAMDEDRPLDEDSDLTFTIDSTTGEIHVSRNLMEYEMYKLVVMVTNVRMNTSDETRITVARIPDETLMNRYSPFISNGFESEYMHVIKKRQAFAIPTEVTFNLIKSAVDDIRVGSRVDFTLGITFPVNVFPAGVDMLVELFTPDNETTVMILCDVVVSLAQAANLQITGSDAVTMDSKDGNPVTRPDRAIINFGTVSNSGTNTDTEAESTIYIDYSAVMIDNPATISGVYYVSAGAEYENENKIWVGQASLNAIADGNLTVDNTASFTVTAPTSMALGSSHLITAGLSLPYPWATYIFHAFTPVGTSGAMSICSVMLDSYQQNFGCGNDFSLVVSSVSADPTGLGNDEGIVNMGTLVNKASRDAVIVTADNEIQVSFVAHVFPTTSLIGQSFILNMALEVDTDTILVGNQAIAIEAAVTMGLTNVTLSSLTSPDLTSFQATQDEPFTLTLDITVPVPSTANVASNYIVELLAPFESSQAVFKVCNLEVLSVGADLPCLNKDELVTVYSSRDPVGTAPDTAVIDLGYVTNMDYHGTAGANVITVSAILSPLSTHPAAVLSSTHMVSLGVNTGIDPSVYIQVFTADIVVQYPSTETAITAATAPTVNMFYFDGDEIVSMTETTKMYIEMTTIRGINYQTMKIEFLAPVDTANAFVHVCRAEIESAGRNIPCLTSEWINELVEYQSTFSNIYMDKALLDVGPLCNHEMVNDPAEDVAKLALYVKVLDGTGMADMDEKWISTALTYSDTSLLVGSLKLVVMTSGTITTPVTSPYTSSVTSYSTLVSLPLSTTASYSLLMKTPPSEKLDLKVTVTSDQEGLDICSVHVVYAGPNVPCVDNVLATRSYTYHANGHKASATIDLGIITNFGTGSMTSNDFADADSIIFEILVHADNAYPAATNTFVVTSYYDTAETPVAVDTVTVVTTSDMTGLSNAIPTPVTGTVSVGEIAGGDNTPDVTIRETKQILLSAVVPDGEMYNMEYVFIVPAASVGKLEVYDAAVVTVGANLPCVDPLVSAVITSTGGVYQDTATFALGYVCHAPVLPGDTDANTIVFAVYVRLQPNGLAVIGETVSVDAVINVFGTQLSVLSEVLTVTDPTTFVDKVMSLAGVTNTTLISLNQLDPQPMTMAENRTFVTTITIPKYSVSGFLFDVDLVHDDSACMTVQDIRVTGSVGRNVICPAPSVTQGITYTATYNSSLDNGQYDYGYLDVGIVTNTGVSHSLGTFTAGDDDVIIEFDVQMADCTNSDDGTLKVVSIGNKVANYIFIYDHNVQVTRDGTEMPDIDYTTALAPETTSTVVYIQGTVSHTALSTAEGRDTSVFIYLPEYQTAPTTLLSLSLPKCTVTTDGSVPDTVLEIVCPTFFFVDTLSFTAEIVVNTSVVLPVGFSADDTEAICEVGTDYTSRYPTYSATDWFPYVTSATHVLAYVLDAGAGAGCVGALGMSDGAIQDCQISGSSNWVANGGPSKARLNGGSGWTPFVRNKKFAENRYLQIYFGNVTMVTKIEIQQHASYTHRVTDLLVEYSNDGGAWFAPEYVYLGASPAELETDVLGSPQEARYIRVSLVNDTTLLVKPNVHLRFEFYGCHITGDVSTTQACADATAESIVTPTDFHYRSFVETETSIVFVCDRDASRKSYRGRCFSSATGSVWSDLDPRLASIIGYEQSQQRLYAYAQNQECILMSIDAGVTWNAVASEVLVADKLLTWTNAISVPEIASTELDYPFPHTMYTMGVWGATYKGMYLNSIQALSWE